MQVLNCLNEGIVFPKTIWRLSSGERKEIGIALHAGNQIER